MYKIDITVVFEILHLTTDDLTQKPRNLYHDSISI